VRPNHDSSEPPLLLIGASMAASGFEALAGYFADRTVVTYDPRGSERTETVWPSSVTALGMSGGQPQAVRHIRSLHEYAVLCIVIP
jgi:hypothetical protein